NLAAVVVVVTDVNASPKAGLPSLVGSIVVGSPLELDGFRGAIFEEQVAWLGHELAEPSGKIFAARKLGQHLGRRAAERAVPRRVAGECRRAEGAALIRDPIQRARPTHTSQLACAIAGLTAPRPKRQLADVAPEVCMALTGLHRLFGDELDQTIDQRQPSFVVRGELGIAALPEPRQVADQAYRSSRYVLALELPRRDGSIVQGSVEGQVDM